MGYLKNKKSTYDAVAYDILKSKEIIKDVCDVHEHAGYYCDMDDRDEVYAIATDELKKQYHDMTDFKFFHKCIDEILENAYIDDKCPFCEKAYNE